MRKVAEARNRHFNIKFPSLAAFVLILLLSYSDKLPAKPVTAEQAEKAVTGWLKADSQPLGTVLAQQTKSVQAFTNEQGEPLYYIVYLQPSGFVIVAADDLVEPIIGFSRAETYDPSPENPLGAIVSRDLPNRIAAARNFEKSAGAEISVSGFQKARGKWATLGDYADTVQLDSLGEVSDVRVPPLIQSLWDQGSVCGDYCYNYYTPSYYICGCVATAMAQLMKFHEYPLVGIGINPFTIYINGTPLTAYTRGGDGSGGPYSWDLMVLEPDCSTTDSQRQAIGALCYDAGVSANMSYRLTFSGAYMNNAQEALIDTFYYSNAVIRGNYPITIPISGLNGMVNPGLDANHPVLFGIYDTVNGYGHAIVCDGYGYNISTLYHHLNMGWSGWKDAWYDLPDIDCSPAPYFNVVDTCIYNIFTSGSGEIISGRITDPSADPLEGVTVTAYGTGGPYTTQTNARGIYALAKVTSNTTFTIEAEKEGWSFSSQIVTTGFSTGSSNYSGNRWEIDFTSAVVSPAGFVEFDEDSYELPQTISVKVVDSDLEGFGSQEVVLQVCDGDTETLTLTENPAGSSIFTGSIAAVEGSASSEDGTIQVLGSQLIVAAYEDANDGTGKAATARDTATVNSQPIIFQTDFTVEPEDWSVIDGGSSTHTWEQITEYDERYSDYWTGIFVIVDSDEAGYYNTMDEQLISHHIDCSEYEDVKLKFNHYFKYDDDDEDEICDVDVRIDGGGWQNVIRFQGANAEGVVEVSLSEFGADGASDVQIRWHYYNADWEYWWGIDDVEVSGTSSFEPTLGDFEPDCDVDLDDLDVLVSAWLSNPGSGNWNASADIYETGGDIIDFLDFAVFAEYWLTGVP